MTKAPLTLFVPGGPGCDCSVERQWFGNTLPIRWWDPPRFDVGALDAYQATVAAAEAELQALATEGPVPVIGFSFGCLVALDLARRAPERIAALTLLSPLRSFGQLAVNLASRLLHKEAAGPIVASALTAARRGDLRADVAWALVESLLGVPDLFDHYWAPHSRAQAERWGQLLGERSFVDPGTFTAVVKALLDEPPPSPQDVSSAIPMRVLLGDHDPTVEPEADLAFWRACFPQAEAPRLDAGHMLQFELSVATWLGD